MEKLTLSVPEAAKVVGVSVSTMYQLVKRDGFPVIVVGKRLLVPARGLERWIEEESAKGFSAC